MSRLRRDMNSGVPATEVARRAGHGVAVLLKIYAHCIDGQADAANERIPDALSARDAEPEPVAYSCPCRAIQRRRWRASSEASSWTCYCSTGRT